MLILNSLNIKVIVSVMSVRRVTIPFSHRHDDTQKEAHNQQIDKNITKQKADAITTSTSELENKESLKIEIRTTSDVHSKLCRRKLKRCSCSDVSNVCITCSQLGVKPFCPCSTLQCRDTVESTVPSLLGTCIDYVAAHLSDLDSLVGFPDIMGRQIFHKALITDVLRAPCSLSLQYIQLFQDAYEDEILHSLRLHDCIEFLTWSLPLSANLYSYVRVLDLTACKLGHDEEQIRHLARINTLRELGLRDNRLADCTVQMLTTPARVCNTGLISLTLLDIACNTCVTDKSVQYLARLRKLTTLDMSGTSLTSSGCRRLERCLGLSMSKSNSSYLPWQLDSIQGWAAPVFYQWLENSINPEIATKTNSAFYATKEKKRIYKYTPPSLPETILILTKSASSHIHSTEKTNTSSAHKKRKMNMPDVMAQIQDNAANAKSDSENQRSKCRKLDKSVQPEQSMYYSDKQCMSEITSLLDSYMNAPNSSPSKLNHVLDDLDKPAPRAAPPAGKYEMTDDMADILQGYV